MTLEQYTESEAETIQLVTIKCYNKVYEQFPNNIAVLNMFREWAMEFEDWWNNRLSEDERSCLNYSRSVDRFCKRKLDGLIKED